VALEKKKQRDFHLNHVGYKAMDEVFDKIISNANFHLNHVGYKADKGT